MKALLLGSIGVLAETSELQRQAYNAAFVAHGVDWHWNIASYCRHLATPGGQNRLRTLGGDALSESEIRRIHETKQDVFAASLAGGVAPRAGIVETLSTARAAGLRIGFVTTTTPRTVTMIQEALAGHIDMSHITKPSMEFGESNRPTHITIVNCKKLPQSVPVYCR